jgi:threonine aldolase
MQANFRSDNEAPVADAIMDALHQANKGTAHAYAEDDFSARLDDHFSSLFGIDTTIIPVSTGTVANSIALACVTPPWGSVYCHNSAHILRDESGAPEFFGNGLRIVGLDGTDGKLNAGEVAATLKTDEGHGVHSYIPSALSLTQSTESGSVYQPDEIHKLAAVAHNANMVTHMDGARFANAITHLGCEPADITWKAGIDMLSFGASKNGCMAAEALLFFKRPDLRDKAERLRKRSGHLLSKMRYLSAQLLTYSSDGLWLTLARHANQQAAIFATAVEAHPGASLEFPVQANEVFVCWNRDGFDALADKGIQFHLWPGRDDLARFVFSWATSEQETGHLIESIQSIV